MLRLGLKASLECRRLTIQDVGRRVLGIKRNLGLGGINVLQSMPAFTVQDLYGIPFSRDGVLRQQPAGRGQSIHLAQQILIRVINFKP